MIGDAEPDLTDPKTLAANCKEMAGAMRQQANAAKSGSASGGAPYPEWTYNKTAQILEACAAYAEKHVPKAPEPEKKK